MHAPLLVSLGAGLLIGVLAQRTRFCTMGSIRDVLLARDFHLLTGVAALVVVAFVANLVIGKVDFGFSSRPVGEDAQTARQIGDWSARFFFASRSSRASPRVSSRARRHARRARPRGAAKSVDDGRVRTCALSDADLNRTPWTTRPRRR